MEEKVLEKVVYHYNDGSQKYIEGEALDNWIGMNRQVAIFCSSHNANPMWNNIKWKWVETSTEKIEINEEYTEPPISAVD